MTNSLKDQIKFQVEKLAEVTSLMDKQYNYSQWRGIFRCDIARFAMYLTASDGEITREEAEAIMEFFGYDDITPSYLARVIEEDNLYSTEFESTPPKSIVYAVLADNYLYTNTDVDTEIYPSDMVLDLYKKIAEEMSWADGEQDENEIRDSQIYISMIEKYIEDNSKPRSAQLKAYDTRDMKSVSVSSKKIEKKFFNRDGFRHFYKKFVLLPLKYDKRMIFKDFPGVEQANAYLAYGYVDHQAGFTFEVLCLANSNNNKVEYYEANDEIDVKIRVENVENEPIIIENDYNGNLKNKFSNRIKIIEKYYETDENILKTREMDFLDPIRHPSYVDDVQVVLYIKNMNKLELVWVRLTGCDEVDKCFYGELIVEPFARCNVHRGNIIRFFLQEEKGTLMGVCTV